MPPTSCERAVLGLITRPTPNTPRTRGTRTSPVSTGELAAVSDAVQRLAGHPPVSLAEHLAARPECLDHVTTG